ncbi:transglutaminase family protein [Xanthobacter tagetidis]|uniref:Transglutaminase family protein n=1 Tax=Xanthobacter tagetidis TaxID=60216 RepID=A0A3L7AJU5_9HYPH|nr:transglutaminase family protein [Xanthobacter tagetidis]MBB6308966.1 transglutaminase-like putative cysteine protease [Xanthobacter tagetidis]RLP80527.1 transglutaminase family protein [Xanthobacter tagetidis]
MRVRIRHEITQTFEPAARNASAIVRLTPRGHEGQYVQRWTLDIDSDTRFHPQEDAFGNLCHAFTVDGPVTSFTIAAEGEMETQDTTGIVRGTVERFPPSLYLRQTDLTHPSERVQAFAREVRAQPDDPLAFLHALMERVHGDVADADGPAMGDPLTAEDALEKGAACSGGIAHLFTAAARISGVPARHISGYLAVDGEAAARHWAEAHVPSIGWVAFDCGRNLCPTEDYVRLAVGLDAVGVASLRGIGGDTREQVVAFDGRNPPKPQAKSQSQTQGQN